MTEIEKALMVLKALGIVVGFAIALYFAIGPTIDDDDDARQGFM